MAEGSPRRGESAPAQAEQPGQRKPREKIDTVELEARLASRLRKREKAALWRQRLESLERKRRR